MRRYALCILAFGLMVALAACNNSTPTSEAACTVVPIREDAAEAGIADGAVIVYERMGGEECIDEVWYIYPDGRILGENNRGAEVEETVPAEDVDALMSFIVEDQEFFDLWSTEHTRCRSCYTYFITVKANDEVKTVQAVDGGTDTPGAYWKAWAEIKGLLPDFPEE